ncbi:MAG: S-layer homology domain-containing protein [Eubacterium sp.]|nr:S-layer homology domain-containing protein [Eubacterium sp.]
MKKKQIRLAALLLGLSLVTAEAAPVIQATAASAVTTATAAKETNPTYSPQLARKVMVATGVMKASQTTVKGQKKKVTRQQFAKMLVQLSPYKDKVGTTVKSSMYADVKKNSSYAPYIRIAVKNGWMKGNLKGQFRPTKAVTLQESVAAVLAMLGYENSDFQGNISSAKMSFYKAEKLNKNITKKASAAMTYGDMSCLLYNMLVTPNKSGTIYATLLDYDLDANGDVAYLPLVYDEMDGPVIAGENWRKQIPFDTKKATIYIDGSKSSAQNIHIYDVLYYSEKVNSIFVYQNRVTGKLNGVLPDRYTPNAVTVSGTSYTLANQDLTYEVSAMGSYEIGDYVTLLLGRDGTVVGMGEAAKLNSFIGGIVLSKTEKVNEDKNADGEKTTEVKKYITMLDTNGEVHEYEVDDLSIFSERTPVEVSFENGKPIVNKVSLARLNGTVSSDAGSFAGYRLSESIHILEYDTNGIYNKVDRNRLAGLTIHASNILYYHVNANKEITDLIIRGVTGDNYKYGILLSASEIANPATMTFMGTYRYQIGDQSGMASSNGQIFAVQGYVGPAQFAFTEDGSISGIKTMNSIEVTSITKTEASNGKQAYMLDDQMSVYLKKGSKYYATELSKVMSLSNYKLTAYYDGLTGGRVRILVAEVK